MAIVMAVAIGFACGTPARSPPQPAAELHVMPPARENSSGASPSLQHAEAVPSFGVMELQEASDYESGSIQQNFNT